MLNQGQFPNQPLGGNILGVHGAQNVVVNFNMPNQQQGSMQHQMLQNHFDPHHNQMMLGNQGMYQQQPLALGYDTPEYAEADIVSEEVLDLEFAYIDNDFKVHFRSSFLDLKEMLEIGDSMTTPLVSGYGLTAITKDDKSVDFGMDADDELFAHIHIRKGKSPILELLDVGLNNLNNPIYSVALYHTVLFARKLKYTEFFILNVITGDLGDGEPLVTKADPTKSVYKLESISVSIEDL